MTALPISPEAAQPYGAVTVDSAAPASPTDITVGHLSVVHVESTPSDVRPDTFMMTDSTSVSQALSEARELSEDPEKAVLLLAGEALQRREASESQTESLVSACADVSGRFDEWIPVQDNLRTRAASQRDNAANLQRLADENFENLSERTADTTEIQTAMQNCFQWVTTLEADARQLAKRQAAVGKQLENLVTAAHPSAHQECDRLEAERAVIQGRLAKARGITGINEHTASTELKAGIAELNNELSQVEEELGAAANELANVLQNIDAARLAFEDTEKDREALASLFASGKDEMIEQVEDALERYRQNVLDAFRIFHRSIFQPFVMLSEAIKEFPEGKPAADSQVIDMPDMDTGVIPRHSAEGETGPGEEEGQQDSPELFDSPEFPENLPRSRRFGETPKEKGGFSWRRGRKES